MKDTSGADASGRLFNLPYLLGVFLAANAIRDLCVAVDGLNCSLTKVDLISGNHDIFSKLLSASGRHRVICTMAGPRPQPSNYAARLEEFIASISNSGDYGAVLVTAMPFMKLIGMDYAAVAAAACGRAPVAAVAPPFGRLDWLDGYGQALDALAGILPAPLKRRREPYSAAIVGYMHDRNEGDHAANIKEMRRLLSLAGVELKCVFPCGGSFSKLSGVFDAGLIISFPYGRKAARRIAERGGARLIETGLPMGFAGTSAWLRQVRSAAGLKGPLPAVLAKEEVRSARRIAPALSVLSHRRLLFAGDPYLCAGVLSFARELYIRPAAAVLDCFPRETGLSRLPPELSFAPETFEKGVRKTEKGEYAEPDLAIANSLAVSEKIVAGIPTVELGFPSYSFHCFADRPFLGYAGAVCLAERLLNAVS